MRNDAMACLGTSPFNLVYPLQRRSNSQVQLSKTTLGFRNLRCQLKDEVKSNDEDEKTEDKSTGAAVIVPDKRVNRRIALASVSGAAGLFVATRGWIGGSVSLGDLSATAVPYDQALRNGMPTVVEFYANWCEVCRELAPDIYKIEQEYKDRVNFVMLNVDNGKWEEELDEFGVEGIPHFAFLDKEGNEEGNVVGRIPRQYLSENVAALARGDAKIPHSRVVGQFSNAESRQVHPVVNPRSHGTT